MTTPGPSIASPRTRKPSFVRAALIALVVGALGLGATSAYVTVPAARDLIAARTILSASADDLSDRDLAAAIGHLERALVRIRSGFGDAIRLVPVIRQNVVALEDLSSRAISALESGRAFTSALEERRSLLEGSVDRRRIAFLADTAAEASAELGGLQRAVERHRSGWLVPKLWHALDPVERQIIEARDDLEKVTALLRVAPSLLASEGRRTYLVMLMNNAELRGSGGIPSGIGTLKVRDGHFKLGSFDHYSDLREMLPHVERVAAPAEFRERFARYSADTTNLVNVTMSPDVPEVALVMSRLYKRITGIETDGALFADPQGIAALLPPRRQIEIPGLDERLYPSELPRFIYSTEYEIFEDSSNEFRREILLQVGEAAFSSFASAASRRSLDLSTLGDAFASGHLRLVSSRPQEQALLTRAGTTGELASAARDSAFITVQNFGGDKLDYWTDRAEEHRCDIDRALIAHCISGVRLFNGAPGDLPDYVTQRKRKATLESFLEIYIPAAARVTALTLNGDPISYSEQTEDGRVAVGTYLEIPRRVSAEVIARYDLPVGRTYSLEMTPQPLAAPARAEVSLSFPSGWTFLRGPGRRTGSTLEYSGSFDATLRFEAAHRPEPSGFTALWESVERFWSEPITVGAG
jgi:hypothetical protein